ncbi:hypothetical protein K505DRAFT_330207 [Melanomma pulvis-pyrius CBS 109.77]|uniref:Uncharacterized protein n=1 Tax=Melanomma pulvis-pyrius CBS 109.77 TaxID=1314802 RepID=A0A6A6WRE0_9PLEO|nr:hypothetical protein K505DRAFT_330207 [Melanomma pulvis-pyrius CBS 109.77]
MSLACISHAARGDIWRLQRPRAPSSSSSLILPASRCASSCGGPRDHSAGARGLFVLVGRPRRTASCCPSSDFICTNSLSRERGFLLIIELSAQSSVAPGRSPQRIANAGTSHACR